ncbi:MAG: glycosyltransferase family 4 protein, partial [Planctomycetota bacterium]|nr:glycosyltransferase family 4 protein [Planctomycetota bacterium]
SVPSFATPCMQKLSCSAVAALKSSLKKEYDIVHFHSFAPGAFAWLPKLRGCKCVLQLHSLEWKRDRWGTAGSWVVKLLEKLALSQSNAYTAVSRTQCAFYQAQRGIRMQYIPTAAEIKPRTEASEIYRLGLKPDEYILFASRLVPEKGAHYLIPAFRRLDTEMKLVIAGDVQGAKEYKHRLLQLADGDPRILFPGFAEGRLIEELFSHCYIYVQPSEVEGLSLSILEAMSYGHCCLVSDIPENLEAIGDTGFTFVSRSIDNLAERLKRLLEHPEEVAAVSAGSKERVRRHYSWQSISEQIEELYYSLLNGQHHRVEGRVSLSESLSTRQL